jgi:hypothetical protein
MSMQIDAQGKTVSMDMVSDGLVVYMRSPVIAQSLPDGKQWLKIDMQKAAQAEGIDMSSMLGGSAGDDLAQLRATSGDVQKVGEEQVAGVDTTHYRATVDFDKAAANAKDDATAKSYRRLAQLVGSQTIPVDVWVDGDDHVRKLDERFSMTTGGKQADMEMSMTFVDFGQQVDVQLPADSDTVDAASLTQKPHA